jgi:hypothetical protein
MFRELIDEFRIYGFALSLQDIVAVQRNSNTSTRISYASAEQVEAEMTISPNPNPGSGFATVQFYAHQKQLTRVVLTDLFSNKIATLNHPLVKGANKVEINLSQQSVRLCVLPLVLAPVVLQCVEVSRRHGLPQLSSF